MTVTTEETIRIGPLAIRPRIEPGDSDGAVAIHEFDVPAGAGLPIPHSHDAYEETIYGLEGELTWTVDGQPITVGPGQAICIPRGAVHRFDNYGHVDARALMVASPALIGPEYFRDVAAVMAVAAGGPPDKVTLMEIYRRYGLTPAVSG